MEFVQLNEGMFFMAALGWVLLQCGSLMAMSKWLCPARKSNSDQQNHLIYR